MGRKPANTSAGFSLIELLIVMAVLAILAAMAVLNLSAGRRAANEASALASVRTVVSAQKVYSLTTGNGSYTTLSNLGATRLIDSALAAGNRQGYTFTMTNTAEAFGITANPLSERHGTRSYYSDQSGIIRWKYGAGAGPEDPTIGER